MVRTVWIAFWFSPWFSAGAIYSFFCLFFHRALSPAIFWCRKPIAQNASTGSASCAKDVTPLPLALDQQSIGFTVSLLGLTTAETF